MPKRRRLAIGLIISLVIGLSISRSRLGGGRNGYPTNDTWITPNFPAFDSRSFTRLEANRVYYVDAASVAETAQQLSQNRAQEISLPTFRKYCAKAPNKIVAPWKPYLVRCVSANDVSHECIVEEDANGRLWTNSGILTHYGVDSVDHTPVIVLLKTAPSDVCVSFSEAE